jgi:hypothetical protein
LGLIWPLRGYIQKGENINMGVGSPWPSLWLQGELGRVGPYVAKFDHDLILGLLVWEGAFARYVTL